jgi:hypothetical protein
MRLPRLLKIDDGKSIVFFIEEAFLESGFVVVVVILNFIIQTLFAFLVQRPHGNLFFIFLQLIQYIFFKYLNLIRKT